MQSQVKFKRASLNSDLNELDTYVTKNSACTHVNLSSYTSESNYYTCPSDGYIILNSDWPTSAYSGAEIMGFGSICVKGDGDSSRRQVSMTYVKKGMKIYTAKSQYSLVHFAPIV